MQQPLEILREYWQHESFRDPQEQIIKSILQGNDTFALLPTGGGKSVCFQVPALMMNGLCLVVSPLIALMKDQVQNLEKKNIKALALTGGLTVDEVSNLLDNCMYGNYKFLYLSPERLESDWIMERIKQLPINLVAIDEAHCVSQWGHDFRPAYLKISNLKKNLNAPFLALTASATKRVKEDIITHLGLQSPVIFQKSFARENISYMVFETEDKLYRIQQILKKNPEPSIIYVRNRKSCIDIANQLTSLGHKATYYHGGLKSSEKETNMQLWLKEKAQVIVATNAFGMGIDKPNVKTVIHIQLPDNLESYYQEAGRAGRNGNRSYAVMLINKNDVQIARNQFIEVLPDKKFLKEVYIKLNNYLQIAYGEGVNESFAFNINDFCNRYQFPVNKTYNALLFLDRQGILLLSKEFTQKVAIQFIIPSREVIRYNSLNPHDEEMILAILRNYPGVFEISTPLNINLIAKKAKVTEDDLMALLQKLNQKEIITLHSTGNDSQITFNEVREDDHTINRVSKFLDKQNEVKVLQFESVVKYVASNKCKSRIILEYFDEDIISDCGICSYCITKLKPAKKAEELTFAILSLLKQSPLASREIEEKLEISPQETVYGLRLLLENNIIKLNTNDKYSLL